MRQRRRTQPRDLPYGEERLRVRWHKVQYACREKPYEREAFTEQIPELPAGARVTGRLPCAGTSRRRSVTVLPSASRAPG